MKTPETSSEAMNGSSNNSTNKMKEEADKRRSTAARTTIGRLTITKIGPSTYAPLTPERRRLAVIPISVFVAMIAELVLDIAFHTVTVIILSDLHTINYSKSDPVTFILKENVYNEVKAHFWALFSNSMLLHLNSMAVVLWGIIPYGIAKGNVSWLKAWTMLKKILICLMLFNVTTIAFGGGSHFITNYFIGFFFYFFVSVIIIEIMTSYTPIADQIVAD